MGDFDEAIQQRDDFSVLAQRLDLDLLRRILEMQREHYEMYGAWLTAGEVLSRLIRGPQ